MNTWHWMLIAIAGLLIGTALLRHWQQRMDSVRRSQERQAWNERQTEERRRRDSLSVNDLVRHFFPAVSDAVRNRVHRGERPRKALREALNDVSGVHLGTTDAKLDVVAAEAWRTRHVVLWGKSGSGKSCTMMHLILGDIGRGLAVIVLCPEAELFRDLLGHLSSRAKDVIYFAPGDSRCPVSFNPLATEPTDDLGRHAEEVFSVMKRSFGEESVGPRSDPLLANAISLVMGRPGATLWSVRQVLTDASFRARALSQCRDEHCKDFWTRVAPAFPRGAELPVVARMDRYFRTAKNALCHPKGSFTLRDVVEQRRILLVDVSGLPADTMMLVGGLITSKLELELLRRERGLTEKPNPVSVFVDEFPAVCSWGESQSFAALLSRSRKYHTRLVLAGQFPGQCPVPLRQQIAGNVSTLISFSLGARDASSVSRELLRPTPDGGIKPVPASALVSLPVGEGYARLNGAPCALRIRFNKPIPSPPRETSEDVHNASWATYGAPPTVRCDSRSPQPQSDGEASHQHDPCHDDRRNGSHGTSAHQRPAGALCSVSEPGRSTPALGAAASHKPTQVYSEASRELAPSSVTTSPRPSPCRAPSSPGRGGGKHRYFQALIKQWAESRGFRAAVEEPIADTTGSVDIVLRNGALAVAVEISVTNSRHQEVKNVRKCLDAGFQSVIVVCEDTKRLNRIKTTAEKALESAEREQVSFCTPDELFTLLEQLDPNDVDSQKIHGYTVNVNRRTVEGSEEQFKREAISHVVAGAMRRLKETPG